MYVMIRVYKNLLYQRFRVGILGSLERKTIFYSWYFSFQMRESADSYDYRIANRFWITNSKKLRECMLDFFDDQMQVTDFHTNPTEVRNEINNWISNMTKGHIRDLLPPNSISEQTELVLANAVYFKGLWAHRFNSKNSKRDIFYASGTQNSVTTFMRQKGNFNYGKCHYLLKLHLINLLLKLILL